jgi:hypothetical protein
METKEAIKAFGVIMMDYAGEMSEMSDTAGRAARALLLAEPGVDPMDVLRACYPTIRDACAWKQSRMSQLARDCTDLIRFLDAVVLDDKKADNA